MAPWPAVEWPPPGRAHTVLGILFPGQIIRCIGAPIESELIETDSRALDDLTLASSVSMTLSSDLIYPAEGPSVPVRSAAPTTSRSNGLTR